MRRIDDHAIARAWRLGEGTALLAEMLDALDARIEGAQRELRELQQMRAEKRAELTEILRQETRR